MKRESFVKAMRLLAKVSGVPFSRTGKYSCRVGDISASYHQVLSGSGRGGWVLNNARSGESGFIPEGFETASWGGI